MSLINEFIYKYMKKCFIRTLIVI